MTTEQVPPQPPPVDVDELERLWSCCTGGEWVASGFCVYKDQNGDYVARISECGSDSLAQFIAAAHNQLPALIAERRNDRQRIAELESEAGRLRELLKGSCRKIFETQMAWTDTEIAAALDRLQHGGGGGALATPNTLGE